MPVISALGRQAGGSRVQGQSRLHIETLLKKKRQKTTTFKKLIHENIKVVQISKVGTE
jgi:hypothetical protein